jgi:hypothetical protein
VAVRSKAWVCGRSLTRFQGSGYIVVHDIMPTNDRLRKINLYTDGKCNRCDHCDTITHRYTMCTNTQPLWDWTRKRIAYYLRTSPQNVLDDWICFPDFNLYPPQRQNATIWILGHMIGYITNNNSVTLQDYLDFMRRARWKEQQLHGRHKNCGRYLDVLDY